MLAAAAVAAVAVVAAAAIATAAWSEDFSIQFTNITGMVATYTRQGMLPREAPLAELFCIAALRDACTTLRRPWSPRRLLAKSQRPLLKNLLPNRQKLPRRLLKNQPRIPPIRQAEMLVKPPLTSRSRRCPRVCQRYRYQNSWGKSTVCFSWAKKPVTATPTEFGQKSSATAKRYSKLKLSSCKRGKPGYSISKHSCHQHQW